MKVLVIDDNPIHQESARQTINNHELTIVGTYDEAHLLINGNYKTTPVKYDVVLSDLLMPASAMTMGTEGMKYAGQEMPVGFALSLMAALRGTKFVAVVTDIGHHDHPASAMLDPFTSSCPSEFNDVGVSPRFVINGAKVGYYHAPMTDVEGTTCPNCRVCECTERNACSPEQNCIICKGTGRDCFSCFGSGKLQGKDWSKVLDHITTA